MKKKLNVSVPPIPKLSFRRFSESNKARETIGQAPGTLIYTGKKREEKVEIEVFTYNAEVLNEMRSAKVEECLNLYDEKKVNWINVIGLHNVDLIHKVGERFQLHPLLLEDVLHVDQRPKAEDFGDYIFFTIKMFHQNVKEDELNYEHISFVLGKNTVFCFQEKSGDLFDLIRERLRNAYGRIRHRKADYIFYRFIDTVVDQYYLVIDRLAERIEKLEDEVMDNPTTKTLNQLQAVRKELIFLRRSIHPLRESINTILKSESKLLQKDTERFFSDVYDHTIQIVESLETYRDLLSGIMDLYMNTASNRMNEIMKVLTIMSTIFIPLTFIAGIYGMNFQYMPELEYKWAYPVAMGVMVLVAIFMLIFFKRKKWL